MFALCRAEGACGPADPPPAAAPSLPSQQSPLSQQPLAHSNQLPPELHPDEAVQDGVQGAVRQPHALGDHVADVHHAAKLATSSHQAQLLQTVRQLEAVERRPADDKHGH